MRLTDIDLSYIAGLFDGEGSVSILKSSCGQLKYHIEISIANRCKEPLEWIQEAFGGDIKSRKRANRAEAFIWRTRHAAAATFLSMLLPFCKIKKQIIEVALNFQTLKDQHSQCTRYTEEELIAQKSHKQALSLLNKRGY